MFVILDESCLPPNVSILNLVEWDQRQSSVNISRSKDFIVQTLVAKPSCNSSQTLVFKWYLFKYHEDSFGKTAIETITLLDTKGTEWNLQKHKLNYGHYFVDFRTALAIRPLVISSALGFFTVTKSPLIANILGGSKVTRGKGSVVTLDGLASSDPDVKPGNHSSMQFTWLCKKQHENFPIGPLASIPVVTTSSGPGRGGCFGTGVGKLSSNGKVVKLDTSQMAAGESYHVKLIVTKDDREDDFLQEINVVSGNPPEVTIRDGNN